MLIVRVKFWKVILFEVLEGLKINKLMKRNLVLIFLICWY